MANPSYYQTSPAVTSLLQQQEHVFHIKAHPSSTNQHILVKLPGRLGETMVINWEVKDGATVVGQLQGVLIRVSRSIDIWYLSCNLVFTDHRLVGVGCLTFACIYCLFSYVYFSFCCYVCLILLDLVKIYSVYASGAVRQLNMVLIEVRFQGSTLSVEGQVGHAAECDLAVLGGTGEFSCAQGNIAYKSIPGGPFELHIRVICLTFPELKQVQKDGTWRGNGGTAYEGSEHRPGMANPSYYQTSLAVTSLVQQQEHVFHIKALLRYSSTQTIVAVKGSFGHTIAVNWEVKDGETVVGQLQGVEICVSPSKNIWYLSCNLVFTDHRFQGSTLSVQGYLQGTSEGNLAVLGGTGEFTCAQGNIAHKRDPNRDLELHIRVVCLTFPKPKPVQKVGPWGGNGGTAYGIQEPDQVPQRLESLTNYDNDGNIEAIEFSYTDQAGQNRTVGTWGYEDKKYKAPPIQFGASETVKEIYGATGKYEGCTVVKSLTIVTNVMAYGPYGKQYLGNTPFLVAAPNGQSIVGFYGSADGVAVNQIGAYVICPN